MFLTMVLALGQQALFQGVPVGDAGPAVATTLRDPNRVIQATLALHIGLANEGTAVLVGNRNGKLLALSANHLFQGKGKEAHATFFGPGDPPKSEKQLMDVDVLDSWPDIDLVLLTVDAPSKFSLPLQLGEARSKPGKLRGTTHTAGCDKGYPHLRPELLIGKVLTTKTSGDVDAFYWEMTDPSIPGRSGGPLVNCDGQIIGICSGTDRKGKGMYIHIDEIRAALKRKGYTELLRK